MKKNLEQYIQGEFILETKPVDSSKNLNIPENSTHIIPTKKDVYFQFDPKSNSVRSYELVYQTSKSFYAQFIKKEGPWSYFKSTQKITVYRDGNISLDSGILFRIKSKDTKKLRNK